MTKKILLKKIKLRNKLFKILLYKTGPIKHYVVEEYKKILGLFWWQQKMRDLTEDKYDGNEIYTTYNLEETVDVINKKITKNRKK